MKPCRSILTSTLLVLLFVQPAALAATTPPIEEQAHNLYLFLKKPPAKWEKFQSKLLKSVNRYIATALATHPWEGELVDLEAVQVIPYDMDVDEGSELFVVYSGGEPRKPGQSDYFVLLLDWVPEKWLFVPVFHKGFQNITDPAAEDEGKATRDLEYWGLRWMDGRPVAVGHRTIKVEGPGTVRFKGEDLVLAWFDWQNKEQLTTVPVRHEKTGTTNCAKIEETRSSYDAFLDVDWDKDVELVVYDVQTVTTTTRTSSKAPCDALPAKPTTKQEWVGVLLYDLEMGQLNLIQGDEARMMVFRSGELEWLDEEPWLVVLGVYASSPDAFMGKEEVHNTDIITTWVFRAGKFNTFSGDYYLVTSPPVFGQKAAKQLCDRFSKAAKACVPVKLGAKPPPEFRKAFPEPKPEPPENETKPGDEKNVK